MNTGDIVIMTTDGMVECRNDNGEHFGVSKLIKSIQKDGFNDSPFNVIKDDLKSFNQQKFDDDISMISIAASK